MPQQDYETRLRVTGQSQFTGAMRAVSGAASLAGSAVRGLTSVLGPLQLAIAGLAGGALLRSLASVGDQFEGTQRVIAGTFASLGMAGNFNDGLALASETMDRITIAAGRLPGEAEDYVAVFRMALPTLQASVGGTLTEMTDFSNRYTAVMQSLQVDSQQAARDLSLMLRAGSGGAAMDNRSWMTLMPFIEHATRETAHHVQNMRDFNRLTQSARGEVLKLTLGQQSMNEMLAAAANSWDAQVGGLKSMMRMLMRLGGAPLFDAMKHWLLDFNSLFLNADDTLSDLSRTIVGMGRAMSSGIVDAVNRLIAGTQTLGDQWNRIAQSPFFQRMSAVGARVASAASAGATAAMSGAAQGTPGGMSGFGGRVTELFITRIEILAGLLDPVARYLGTFASVAADLAVSVLPGLLQGLNSLLEPVVWFAGIMADAAATALTQVRPALHSLFQGVGRLAVGLGQFLAPVVRLLGGAMHWLYEHMLNQYVPVFQVLGEVVGFVAGALGDLLSGLGRAVSWLADQFGLGGGGGGPKTGRRGAATPAGDSSSWLTDMLRHFRELGTTSRGETAEALLGTARPTPGARGGANVHQDFRNSRFDVTQKFAEGFDPDRIAVAFASDVGRIGAERLQSGFEPMFSIR